MNKARYAKLFFAMSGMNCMKRSEGQVQWMVIGVLMVLFPVTFEMFPYAKRLIVWFCCRRVNDDNGEAKKTDGETKSSVPINEDHARAKEVLNDESLARTTVTFEPGQLGFAVTADGVVSELLEGGQAAKKGVRRGWHVLEVDGAKPNHHDISKNEEVVPPVEELIVKRRGGFEPYTIMFLTEQEIVEGNSNIIDHMVDREKQIAADKAAKAATVAEKEEGLRQRKPDEAEKEDKS